MPCVGQIGDAVDTCVEFEWNIKDFFSLSNNISDFYVSPSFSFAGSRWHLSLYPNTTTDQSEGWVGLYLIREGSGPPKTMIYTLGIKASNGAEEKSDEEHKFSKQYIGYGGSRFLSRSDLSRRKSILAPNNVLTVTCCLRSHSLSAVNDTSPVSIDQAVQADHAVVGEKKVLKSLLSLLESGDDSDVAIKVRGKEFLAHRNILRARSPVFRSMFAHEMVEKSSGVVNIEDCDPETFSDFLVHIYSGSCALSAENACSLYMAADKYNVSELKEACSEFMKRNVIVECFCDVITLAVKHNDKDLIECATNFFCNNSVNIAKTAGWQTFLAENSTIGNELFLKAMSKYTMQ